MTTVFSLRPIPGQLLPAFKHKEEEASFGSLATQNGNLPLRQLLLDGKINGLAYSIRMQQTFRNVFSQSLEATYIFPLPARGAVTRFVMRTESREVVGELRERGQAREIYDQAIRQGHQAAIAEEERPEVFTMRVGNIPAGEEVTIDVELSGPLAIADGMATFRFPLVVAPRYIPGAALGGPNVGDGIANDTDATPDASRITPPVLLPGFPNPVRLGLRIELEPAGIDFDEVYTSIDQLYLDGNSIVLAPTAGKLNQDLILRFPVMGEQIQTSVQQVEDEDGFTYSLTVVPPEHELENLQRNLVVLLDRSGSMSGWKMAAARRAVGRIVDSFTDQDRFAVMAFDNVVEELATQEPGKLRHLLNPGTDRNRFRTVQELGKVEARGGTELGMAMILGVERLQQCREGERFLVVVTDGQVGNESQILQEMQQKAKDIRIFTIGIDRAVNAGLLQRLAQYSGGHCELVESEDRLDQVMLALQRRLCKPILTDIEIDAPTHQVAASSKDLFPGLPARIYGRSHSALPGRVTVRARDRSGKLWTQEVDTHTTQDLTVRSLWARERLLELDHGYTTQKNGEQYTAAAITQFSLAYTVLCRFTAFVAVDRQSRVKQQTHKVTQAVDLPAGWAAAMPAADPFGAPGMLASMAPAAEALDWCVDAFAAPTTPTFGLPGPAACAPPPPPARCAKPALGGVSGKSGLMRSMPSPMAPLARQAPANKPSLEKRKREESTDEKIKVLDLIKRITALLDRFDLQGNLAIRLVEELLQMLSARNIDRDLLQKGYKVLENLKTQHPGAKARLEAWLKELEEPADQSRKEWWK